MTAFGACFQSNLPSKIQPIEGKHKRGLEVRIGATPKTDSGYELTFVSGSLPATHFYRRPAPVAGRLPALIARSRPPREVDDGDDDLLTGRFVHNGLSFNGQPLVKVVI